MKPRLLPALIIAAVFLVTFAGLTAWAATSTPCTKGSNTKVIRCLSNERGLKVNTHEALKIADCEGARSRYVGPWSLLKSEYRTFQHQGPDRIDRWFRDNPQWTGRKLYPSTVAVMAHSSRYGWGWSSCS